VISEDAKLWSDDLIYRDCGGALEVATLGCSMGGRGSADEGSPP
jgi:hypothetical protein